MKIQEHIVECVCRVRACLANLELLLRPIVGVPMVKTCVLPLRRLGEMREALRTVAPCGSEGLLVRRVLPEHRPGGSVRGERANFTGLVLGCIEAKFCK